MSDKVNPFERMSPGWKALYKRVQAKDLSLQDDSDPPSYLPVREPLQPRIPDLCPDESEK